MQLPYVTEEYLAVLPLGSEVPVLYMATQPVEITLSQTEIRLAPGEYERIVATIVPADAGTVEWSSSDESVAKVLGGFVEAVADGTAVITAKVGRSKATCVVTVVTRTYNNHHEYVDLGLPSGLKWATMNVGVNSPEEYGNYYAWAETSPKDTYSWSNYKYCGGSATTLTKYNVKTGYGMVDNKTVLDFSDDAANVNWGSTWRMPTFEEFRELNSQCTKTHTTLNGVKGLRLVGPNGNSIFLPASGHYEDDTLYSGERGWYRSNTLNPDAPYASYSFNFIVGGTGGFGGLNRDEGAAVRPVCQ
ncbi:MAG: Ig-like domain-containing protein [Bacteroidaceae bacterium]|nr:Ig-like domain-containing protein [Bacteroidaceae bacterium]